VGEGEWAAAKYGGRGRRGWKKLHLGVDRSGVIIAEALTDGDVHDAKAAIDLLGTVKRSRSYDHESEENRAPPVEEGVGIPSSSPSGEHILSVQNDRWPKTSRSESGVTTSGGDHRLQHPQPDDRSRKARIFRD
jgi:hypothetical protein